MTPTHTRMPDNAPDQPRIHLRAYKLEAKTPVLTHEIPLVVERITASEAPLLAYMPGMSIRDHLGTIVYSTSEEPSLHYLGVSPDWVDVVAENQGEQFRFIDDELYAVGEPMWVINGSELELSAHMEGPLWSLRSWEAVYEQIIKHSDIGCTWPQNNPLAFAKTAGSR